uniref:phosphoethanolamine N-methyltransferase n=1 Tax=Chlamydomonas asymmetrica TaxID=51683 RepID=A0A125SQH6_9CHLO|nr:phosphoethanolamine N-methyltransferase [Chlamydomonas asymmetrica]
MTHTSGGLESNGAQTDQEREVQKQYWKEHSSQPTVEAMMLDSKAAEIDQLERPEVLSLLGDVSGKDIVELGAGIGRFTGELADRGAKSIHAVDFMEASIEENRRINGKNHPSISFQAADVTELELPEQSYDIVFSNWLLMYLSDAEVEALAAKMLRWLRPGGCVFFRESCFKQSGDKARKYNPTHYRNPREYFRIFDSVARQLGPQHQHLELQFCKCVDTYVQVKRNQNQICWKWTKAVDDAPRGDQLRHFLDSQQYASDNIARYEAVFGHGFTSPGGAESAAELSAMLGLKGGERVLDVGCGVGGSTYAISEAYGCHCHGLDLSVNAVLAALERATGRPGADVTFEVADCMVREYEAGSFDVVYSRDVLLHVADKAALVRKFYNWLKPGGRILITDYCAPDAAADANPNGNGADTNSSANGSAGADVVSSSGASIGDAKGASNGASNGHANGHSNGHAAGNGCASAHHDQDDQHGLQAYLSSRRYSLASLAQYSKLMLAAGFADVVVEDRTQQFIKWLTIELERLQHGKEAFVSQWGQAQFDDFEANWQAKIRRAQSGVQRWGLVTARKPE